MSEFCVFSSSYLKRGLLSNSETWAAISSGKSSVVELVAIGSAVSEADSVSISTIAELVEVSAARGSLRFVSGASSVTKESKPAAKSLCISSVSVSGSLSASNLDSESISVVSVVVGISSSVASVSDSLSSPNISSTSSERICNLIIWSSTNTLCLHQLTKLDKEAGVRISLVLLVQ